MQKILFTSLLCLSQLSFAAQTGGRSITIHTQHIARVVTLFKHVSELTSPPGDSSSATTCGYIFPGDGNKFGCKGSGRAAADVAAACSGGGELACTGSGSSRTCTCAFD